jgi:hypothetical protein
MKEKIKSIVCKPYDLPFRWLVQSTSRKDEWHLVQIDSFNLNGSCSCEHFEIRIRPSLLRKPDETVELYRKRVRPLRKNKCKHIIVARECFTNMLVKKLQKEY